MEKRDERGVVALQTGISLKLVKEMLSRLAEFC